MSTLFHPTSLVETSWLYAHLHDPKIRIIESNQDARLYHAGHIPNAVHLDWRADLRDFQDEDYITSQSVGEFLSRHGATPQTTIILYGDDANCRAAFAHWIFHLFGHTKIKLLSGGRAQWEAEGRPCSSAVPSFRRTHYEVPFQLLALRLPVAKRR